MNDDQNDMLDAEFRQILYILKPHINHINDHFQLERFRIWLERLSAAHPSEKLERNKYLLELANQVHDNSLGPPFTYNPPQGLLPTLQGVQNVLKESDPAGISDHFFKKEPEGHWPYPNRGRTQTIEKNTNKRFRSYDHSPPKKKTTAKPFQKIGRNDVKSETSSWCDLSESETSLVEGCGDEKIQISLSTQKHIEAGLKLKEEFRKKYEEEIRKVASNESKKSGNENKKQVELEEFVSGDDRISRKPTQQEVEALKMRMKDLLEVKNALRDTHCLTEDRKKTIEELRCKLSKLQQENSDLQLLLDSQQKKFVELDQAKNRELSEFKEKFAALRQKETDFLKKYHKEEVTSLEKSHSSKLHEMQLKIQSLKKDYEEKVKNLSESNMSLMKQKDETIQQLQSHLKMKESESTNGNSEQINQLKRCISKLDKIIHKNEREYVKKIEKLRQELEVKEMTSQVQLQTQRAEVIVQTTAAKQEEVKNALSSLEGKYKKMMENIQMHALEAKKHDEEEIDRLKLLLHKHNIAY